jgi:peptidoglycan-associated lipoprotein
VTPPLTPASNIRTAQAQTSLEALHSGKRIATYEGIVLKDIYFEFNSFDLSGDARATLRAAADWLRDHPAVRAEIEGHSDERGTSEYNLALGAKRAYAAKDYLISMGVAEHRLSTISYGEEIPVCREASEECWQRNRRARFVPSSGTPGI